MMDVQTITPKELEDLRRQGRPVELIDVRTPVEYREVHAEPARLVPLDALDPRAIMEARDGTKDEPLYMICRSGGRGRQAAERFHAAGFTQRRERGGGHDGLGAGRAARRPRARRSSRWSGRCGSPPARWSMLGTALGAFVHPAFLALSGFVGAGLVFAGVTDTCGMGMMLARMPWNRAEPEAATCPR